MSLTDTADNEMRAIARETRSILKGAGAQLAGKKRGEDRQVRRDSYDIDDPRAQVWTKINGGTKAGGLAWADALLQTAEEFDVVHKKKGERGPLQANGIRVLRAIVRRALDFKDGRSEPELLTIMKWTGLAKNAVVGALARLRKHGFIAWVRRTRRTGEKGQPGPQRKQTSNAYHFEHRKLAKGVLQRFRQLLDRRNARIGTATPTPPGTIVPAPIGAELAQALAGLDGALTARSASS